MRKLPTLPPIYHPQLLFNLGCVKGQGPKIPESFSVDDHKRENGKGKTSVLKECSGFENNSRRRSFTFVSSSVKSVVKFSSFLNFCSSKLIDSNSE